MSSSLIRIALLLCCVALLPACSWFSSDKTAEPVALVSFKETARLHRLWSNRVGDQGDEKLYIRLTPAIDGNVIYAANAKGQVMAISRDKGSDIWNVDTHEALISAVGAGDGLVFVSTVRGVLIALQQDHGKEVWRVQLSSQMLAAAQTADGVVVAQTIDGKVVGLEKNNGTQRWQYGASVPSLTLRTSATPVLENGVAYLAFASGKVVAIDTSNGLQLWEQQVTMPEGRTELERLVDFDGKPLLIGTDMYVADYQGRAVMLDKTKGTVTWSEKVSTANPLAYGDGNLYVTQNDDTVVALKMATGRRLWENNQFARRQLTAPAVIGDYVAIADFDGYIHLLNQSDGQLAGRYSLWWSKGVRNAMLGDGDRLYVLTNGGRLTALELAK